MLGNGDAVLRHVCLGLCRQILRNVREHSLQIERGLALLGSIDLVLNRLGKR
jgi:hypothetical protein